MAAMTKRERVLRAARFEETDRVPVFDIFQNTAAIEHYAGRKLTVEGGTHTVGVAAGHALDMTRFVQGPEHVGRGSDDKGLVYEVDGWNYWVVERPFKDLAGLVEWVKGQIREAESQVYGPADRAYMQDFVQQHWAAFAEGDPTGRNDPAVLVLESSVGLTDAFTQTGWDLFVELMAEHPDLLDAWIEANNQRELRKVAAIADPEYLPVALTFDDIAHKTATIFSPDWLREHWVPRLKRLVDAWHERGTLCLFHSDGRLWDIMDDLVAAGIDGLNPVETQAGMTVKAVRERYPDLFMAGGIDVSQLLPYGTPDEVREACQQAIADTGGRGYFLGSTTLLHESVPLGNIQTMVETAWASDGGARQRCEARKMTERLQVYACLTCKSAVAVMRGGPGELVCCGQPMQMVKAAPDLETPPEEELQDAPLMEYNLNMPVKTVMEFIQKRIANKTSYFGIKTLKNPMDFWVYREIICEVLPDVLVEIGNAYGGSALAFAHIFDMLGKGRIIGVDYQHETVHPDIQSHPRITFVDGDACHVADEVKALIHEGERVLVLEDSLHSYENTLTVLRLYHPLVSVGSYLIVEDSNCHHGVDVGPSPGPYEAIETFLQENDDFECDRSRESFFITWNPKGFLKRVK